MRKQWHMEPEKSDGNEPVPSDAPPITKRHSNGKLYTRIELQVEKYVAENYGELVGRMREERNAGS